MWYLQLVEARIFSPSCHTQVSQNAHCSTKHWSTLYNFQVEWCDSGPPPCSTWRNFKSECPLTLYFHSRKDSVGVNKWSIFRNSIAQFLLQTSWSFQENCQDASAHQVAVEGNADTHRSVCRGSDWDATICQSLSFDRQEHRIRNINFLPGDRPSDAKGKIAFANFDGGTGTGTGAGSGTGTGTGSGAGGGSGTGGGAGGGAGTGTGSGAGGGAGGGAGTGTGSGAGGGAGGGGGTGTGSGAGGGAGGGAGTGTGSGAGAGAGSGTGSGAGGGSGTGTGRMIGMIGMMVAPVATPPTPAWMCCHAMVWVFWVAHFRTQLNKDLVLI